MKIVDCLGREREPDKVWPDGSYNCPFCGYAAGPAGCNNPACFARRSPPFPPEEARKILAREEAKAHEEEQRKELEEWRRSYGADRRREERERLQQIQETALAAGACVKCALHSGRWGRPKYIKHRKACKRL